MPRLVLALLLALAVLPLRAATIEEAVERQLRERPLSSLIDLYKSFFQDAMGPGHMIADTAQARRYLMAELAAADSVATLEPCGQGRHYMRASLGLVHSGVLTADQLLKAFLKGQKPVTPRRIRAWRRRWARIQRHIDRMHLALPHYARDRELIARMLAQGQYAVHHSEAYAKAYRPHYRIVPRKPPISTDVGRF